jgi:hypothetical protein
MSAIAVIVGIDDYEFQPLTTATRDAVAFRDALLDLNLADAGGIVLLTLPRQDDSAIANRSAIVAALRDVYERAAGLDRFFFYFAGHGLSAWTSSSRSSSNTALVPGEVVDLGADANLLLNFDDLRSRMEWAGPTEQYFFVDACRDLAFGERPGDLPGLGWRASENPRDEPSSQAVLYAVSQGGQALGVPQGMGVMTSHLIEALYGRGLALDWSEDDDAYVVTSESIARHVRDGVRARLSGTQFWKLRYMVPDLRPSGPPLTPLRIVDSPPRPAFTLHFDPLAAAGWTNVHLRLRGQLLREPSWPPHAPGQPVTLDPQVYRIDAKPDHGTATAEPVKIDLRRMNAATIRFTAGPLAAVPTARGEPGPGAANIQSEADAHPSPDRGFVQADADEPQTVIELARQDPPYRRWEAAAPFVGPWAPPDFVDVWQPRGPHLGEEVPPGNYAIRFRLGNDVYCEADFDVVAGETKTITPSAGRSPAIAEAVPAEPDGSVLLSETIGPMRSSALLTALPIVGVLPFDATRELFSRFRYSLHSVVDPVDISAYGDSPVRVVVAADGVGWPVAASEVAAGVQCELVAGTAPPINLPLIPLASGTDGWARLAHGTLSAPARSFVIRFSSPVIGAIEMAAASLFNRITVVGLVLSPDGGIEAIQHLLRVPGQLYPGELEPNVSYGRTIRELVLGQRLYESNELIARGAVPNAQVLRDLLFAKWTDPVLGCMAYYAWNDAVERGLPEAQGVDPSNTIITAQNLLAHFPDLPDARIIGAIANLPSAPPTVAAALAGDELPVLSRSLREVAADRSRARADLDLWASQVAPESPWTLVWRTQVTPYAPSLSSVPHAGPGS